MAQCIPVFGLFLAPFNCPHVFDLFEGTCAFHEQPKKGFPQTQANTCTSTSSRNRANYLLSLFRQPWWFWIGGLDLIKNKPPTKLYRGNLNQLSIATLEAALGKGASFLLVALVLLWHVGLVHQTLSCKEGSHKRGTFKRQSSQRGHTRTFPHCWATFAQKVDDLWFVVLCKQFGPFVQLT